MTTREKADSSTFHERDSCFLPPGEGGSTLQAFPKLSNLHHGKNPFITTRAWTLALLQTRGGSLQMLAPPGTRPWCKQTEHCAFI